MKHILIASLGGPPAVITETLWAMMNPTKLTDPAHQGRPAVAPDVIHFLATDFKGSFASVDARETALRAKIVELYAQLSKPAPKVIVEYICWGGARLPDIRSQADNVLYANAVTDHVRSFCSDPNNVVHMLLAGGRKSMSSYDQSAMMFFGRAQDEVIHVLVDRPAIEGCSDFWWPDQPQKKVLNPTFPK